LSSKARMPGCHARFSTYHLHAPAATSA
jgi:hypothetical protein